MLRDISLFFSIQTEILIMTIRSGVQKNKRAEVKLKRLFSLLGVDINPFPWLSLAGRFGYDTYKNDGYVFIHPESYVLTAATGGSLDNYYRTYKGYNHTITATAKKK